MTGGLSSLSFVEGLTVAGVAQCLVILVYVVFRARNWRQASVAIAYFFFLALFFVSFFALRLDDFSGEIRFMLWLCGHVGRPLCYLLVLQVVRMIDIPEPRHFWILLATPVAASTAALIVKTQGGCEDAAIFSCARFFDVLYWAGAMTGAFCMLAIWFHRNVFEGLKKIKGGRERYWLVMTLITANVLVVSVNLLRSMGQVKGDDADGLLVILGIAFAYLASTTLFRVYPSAVDLNAVPRVRFQTLNDEEREIAGRIRLLMEREKLYQEPAFSRADLAREAGCSESVASKIVNVTFGKSLPRLISEYRVEDAKRLLQDPAIPIQTVASEAGFNSLATFNRVFREIAGESPSSWRTWYLESHRK